MPFFNDFLSTDWFFAFEAFLTAAHYWDASFYLLWRIFTKMGGKESCHNLQHHPWIANTFCFTENGSSQITEWCLQQSLSLSSPCFHDNDMTCLAPPKEGGRQALSFSLRQNAFSPLYSYSLTGKHNTGKLWTSHNKTQLFSQLQYFPTVAFCFQKHLTPTTAEMIAISKAKYVLYEEYEILL